MERWNEIERKTDEMKRDMINMKRGCRLHDDADGSGRFIISLCASERQRASRRCYMRLCLHTYLPVCVSVCTLTGEHMNMHVCVRTRERRELSLETDHPMMGDHWKIGLIFHTYLSMEMPYIKNVCHLLKWQRRLSSDRLCILICSDTLCDGGGRRTEIVRKVAEERRVSDIRPQLLTVCL